MDAHHANIDENNEEASDEQVTNHMVLYLHGNEFGLVCFQSLKLLVVAGVWSLLEACTESHGKVLSIKVTQISLIVDRDCWVSRHSHKVLPMPVNGEDLVLRLIF
jgi:hypothetical protein